MIGEWLLLTLFTYRVWRLLGLDSIADRPREALPAKVYELVTCPWCLGFWLAFIVFGLVHYVWHPLWMWPIQAGAAATVVGLIGARDG